MRIFVTPSDVLLFRDGRPFTAGEAHRARCIFPPLPTTLRGALHAHILAERCRNYEHYSRDCQRCPQQAVCDVPNEVGTPSQPGPFEIKGPLVAVRRSGVQLVEYFPLPRDVVRLSTNGRLALLQPRRDHFKGKNDLSDQGLLSELHSLWPDTNLLRERPGEVLQDPQEDESQFLSWDELRGYLGIRNYELGEVAALSLLAESEPRFGVGINNQTLAADEGLLYQAEFKRLRSDEDFRAGFVAEVTGLSLAEKGLLILGGRSRAAAYSQEAEFNSADSFIRHYITQTRRFKLYFATPAIFDSGWRPGAFAENLTANWSGVNCKLIAAAVGQAQAVSGFNVVSKESKETRRALPAGTVLYFEMCEGSDADDVLSKFHWQNLSDRVEDARSGFGLALAGGWDYV